MEKIEQIYFFVAFFSAILYIKKTRDKEILKKYKRKDGKFDFTSYSIDFTITIAMGLAGVYIGLMLFKLPALQEYQQYKNFVAVFLGLTADKTLPILLELFIDKIEEKVNEFRRK